MIEKKIENIAYQLQQNKEAGAIVFIGAGCSISAGIPGAEKIVDYVLENYKDNPDIKCLTERPSYAGLMECLGPVDRKKIFKHYVDDAKINVSHIYLAHLMYQGYVDYIVTVNFDNLAQRALALYNIFPPTYDISVLKDLTTTSLNTQSISYLHGQYNGLWQLNTLDEMGRANENSVTKSIFDKITNSRLWIVVGYSGEDPIFDQLVKLGRFDNGLYWIGYKDNEPATKVQTALLNKPNTESFWVKGYDADSFFLKLNAELKNEEPKIFNKPFSFLSEIQEGIKDIDDSDDYKSVKERFVESKRMVTDAINKYEETEHEVPLMTPDEIEKNQLKQALINCLIKEKYEGVEGLEEQILSKGYKDLLPIIADVYNNWGIALGKLAQTKTGVKAENLYAEAYEKFSKVIEIEPNYHEAYNSWGAALGRLAQTKTGVKAENLYVEACEKFSKVIEIEPNYHEAYNNWGAALGRLAQTKTGVKAENLYAEACEKFSEAIKIKPNYHEAYTNWGAALLGLAQTKTGVKAENLYAEAFEKYSKAIKIKPNHHEAYTSWGAALLGLAQTKTGVEVEDLYTEAFEKYSKAVKIKPNYHEAYNNWGVALGSLAQTKKGLEANSLYAEAFEKLNAAINLGSSSYNLACFNAITNNLDVAFRLLEICLRSGETTFEFVESDHDWDKLRQEPAYKALKQQFLK